jgi:oxygen-independent coproporphyrinogen-3 oxidase
MDTLGLYISFPFCRVKCSYCNFASGVFAPERMQQYVGRLCDETAGAKERAKRLEAEIPDYIDTIYFGGGTPSLMTITDVERVFTVMRKEFEITDDAEITMECAPGQLSDELLATWLRLGVNRVSLGVQSFIDSEAAAVGRLHTREICRAEMARLRAAGIANINVDLIAGLPHQTAQSWAESLDVLLETDVPHASVYMFEVDEDSRLGLEILQGGNRYRAADTPPGEMVADFYLTACERLNAAGILQYEISNFARAGFESRHNMRYWQRQPYLGIGLDAHSMLRSAVGVNQAVRFANTEDLDRYCAGTDNATLIPDRISAAQALEEAFFLGLRTNAGIDLETLREEFGAAVEMYQPMIAELAAEDFLEKARSCVRLTEQGRLLSNEVFGRLLETVTA